ncbi:DUF2225 domain-containing protein [Caldisalinibacter kiritimatiensis]|uniref:DUF2225 domain-containing protein n=1 Tax=Caldisalinibacter kiritimatiensis TaxID=1304284 RepID=R1ARZ0_9FIRM|nr:DUF2225 domain-containing protein [Caldisalinibacter kiritimatiensis]EOC99907.1 hypothetical protein L21TH_2059 [Caldisalinibacter kiritimatiensis]
MSKLYDKKVECPICGNEFTTKKVLSSKLRVEKRDTDFMTYYKTENPIKYDVFVCSECGYSAMEKNFNKIRPEWKEIIKDKITTRWKKRDYSGVRSTEQAIECYKLALYCGELLGLSSYHIANICLRLTWLYRILESEEETKFMRFSLEKYKDFYYNGTFTQDTSNDATIAYLIGELHRRLGEYQEAITWFSNAISSPQIKNNLRLEKMTREQWRVAKESAKKS